MKTIGFFENCEPEKLISDGVYVLKRQKQGSVKSPEYGAFYRAYDYPCPYPFSTQKAELVRHIIGSLSPNVEGVADFLASDSGQSNLDARRFSKIYSEVDSNFLETWTTNLGDVYEFESLTGSEKESFIERICKDRICSLVA